VGRPIVLLGVGSVMGLLSGIFASRLLEKIVYQVNPSEPVVVGAAVLTMALLGHCSVRHSCPACAWLRSIHTHPRRVRTAPSSPEPQLDIVLA